MGHNTNNGSDSLLGQAYVRLPCCRPPLFLALLLVALTCNVYLVCRLVC